MNAIVNTNRVALSLPDDLPFDEWLNLGRDLAAEERNLRWLIGDWCREGHTRFGEQARFDFLSEQLAIDTRQLKQAAKVAEAFPAHLRASDVPYEVHAYVAALPESQRMEALQRASRERWGVRQARQAITLHRQEAALFEDEDSETRLAVEIIRAWNRAPRESREYFWALAEAANLGAINEDEVTHA